MKTFAAFALAGVASASQVRELLADHEFKFLNFMAKWNRSYSTIEEYEQRLVNFVKKDLWIDETNANPLHTFTVGHNNFSDMTEEEFAHYTGLDVEAAEAIDVPIDGSVSNYPTSIDWRAKGAV